MSVVPIPVTLFWYQTEIPPQVLRCFDSWDAHPGLRARAFTLGQAQRFFDDAGLTTARAAFETCGPFAMASDYLRLHLLKVHGGVYVDANWAQIVPMRPLLDQTEAAGHCGLVAEITEISRSFDDPMTDALLAAGAEILLNGFLFVTGPDDPFISLCAEICTRNIETRACEQIAFAAGSGVMTALLMLRNYETRAAYVAALREIGQNRFFGHDVRQSLEHVIAATDAWDHGALRDRFARVDTIPGPALETYMTRQGLGQTHKDHWTRHKGSLYRG